MDDKTKKSKFISEADKRPSPKYRQGKSYHARISSQKKSKVRQTPNSKPIDVLALLRGDAKVMGWKTDKK